MNTTPCWLGYDWAKEVYASDFFDTIYAYAERLITEGKAFVDDLSPEEISATRGTLTEPGKESPYKTRSAEENLKLFREMRDGKYADGEKCLRAKIDMASPNMNLREPLHILVQRCQERRIQPSKKREYLIADAVALVGGISVGAVLVPTQPVRYGIFINIPA